MSQPSNHIPFNVPTLLGNEHSFVQQVVLHPQYFKSRHFTQLCHHWLNKYYPQGTTLLTNSCTQALELSALLLNLKPSDEVIMPSYTYVSTANAFVLRGAVPVFVDVKPTDLNIDEELIEAAITPATKAIVVVHYAGVACNMDRLIDICRKHNLYLIEDNAQGIMSTYKGKALGSFGHISCISFDFMKNLTCGEGGAITVNDPKLANRLEEIYENGTDRNAFQRDEVPFYSWKHVGSNFYPSDLIAAFLWPQLQQAKQIAHKRLADWRYYHELLTPLAGGGLLELPTIDVDANHNGHIFYIKLVNEYERLSLITMLKEHQIDATWHYIPLHSTIYGQHVGRFNGLDNHTTVESKRILRLPLFYTITNQQIERVCALIKGYLTQVKSSNLAAVSK